MDNLKQMKIDQSGGKGDYDLKQQQQPQQPAMRSSADVQKNASSVLQNQHPESHLPRATSQPQQPAKPAVAKRTPADEPTQRQNGTNGKTPTVTYFESTKSKRFVRMLETNPISMFLG